MSQTTARNIAQSSTFFTAGVRESDPELFSALTDELGRQQGQIELIASENIVSKAVLQAMGSVLTNKYAEGYPGRRYYGGCKFVDVAEQLAIDRAKELSGSTRCSTAFGGRTRASITTSLRGSPTNTGRR